MKPIVAAICAVCLLAAGYATGMNRAAQAPAGNVEPLLARLKSDLVLAYINKSAAELERIYADDFTVTDAEGNTRTKADELANLQSATLTSGEYKLVKVRVFGDVAVASGHADLRGTSESGPYRRQYYSFNVFVKRDGRWQYAAAFTP